MLKLTALAEHGGTEISGSLIAQDVRALGQEVVLQESAFIDASGLEGGTVLIGGDYQGKNPAILNAKHVTVQKGAAISLDGTAGNGGRAILWGNEGIFYGGDISAQALGNIGDGGFVEISSPGAYFYKGTVNTLSKRGKAGMFLMDPVDITINTTGPTSPALPAGPTVYTPSVNAVILDSDLVSSLSTGNVTLNTSGGATGNGDVSFNAGVNVTWAQPTDLTVNADRSLSIASTATIENTGSGNITLNANTAGTTVGSFDGIDNQGDITCATGTITLEGHGGTSNGYGVNINSGGTVQTSNSGAINITGVGGGSAGPGNTTDGVRLVDVGSSIVGTSSPVTINGTGGTGTSTNRGVLLGSSTSISTTSGTLTMNGRGGTGGVTQGIRGVSCSITTTSGDVLITGNGGSSNQGVAITNGSSISTLSGAITIEAQSSSSVGLLCGGSSISSSLGSLIFRGTSRQQGCQCNTSSIFSTTSGSITLEGNSSLSHGIEIQTSTLISTDTGDVIIQNTSGGAGGGRRGLYLNSNGRIESTSGSISISATGGTSSTDNNGVEVSGLGSLISTGGAGSISITGTGRGTGDSNIGISVNGGGDIITTDGNLTLEGTGSTSGDSNNHGIDISGSGSTIQTGLGSLIVQNTLGGGNGTGTGNNGLKVDSSAVMSTTGGSISITATGGSGTADSNGVMITDTGSQISGTISSVTVNGTGGGSGIDCHGVHLAAAGAISSTTGALTVNGTGAPTGTAGGYGVFLTGTSTLVQSSNGLISVTGNGGGTGANAEGIGVFSDATIASTGTGGLTLNGTASTIGGDTSRGIVINGASSALTTVSGDITVNGIGGGTGTDSSGLEVSASGKISSTSGSISGTCQGAAGTSGCAGIFVTGTGSLITTASGTGITLTGTGKGTTTSNQGISLTSAGSITTTNNVTSTPITLTGTGSLAGTASNEGIFLSGVSTTISTINGSIQMAGTAGGGTTSAVTIDNGAIVTTSTSGDITTTAIGSLSLLAGASGSAQMTTSNGDITVNASGSLVVTGSSALNTFAQMTVGNAANTISITSLGASLTGGTGSGAFAEISTVGGLLSIDGAGPMTLTGGSNTNTQAQIITLTNAIAGNAIQIGQTTPPTSMTLTGGSGGTSARAIIASDVGGSLLCTTSGIFTATGGSSADASQAGLYAGFTSGSGNITAAATHFLLTGGSNAGTNRAEISTPSGGGSITLTGSSGTSILQGGSGAITQARIIANGAGSISLTQGGALSLLGSTTAGGTNASATISTTNGNIGINASGLLTQTGGSQTGTLAQVTVGDAANTVSITSLGASLSGGTGSGAFAEISTLGGLLSIDGAGPMTLTGGSNTNTQAQIVTLTNAIVGNAIQIGQTTPPTSLTLQGGSGGTLSRAVILSDRGGNILTTLSGGCTIAGGSSADDSRAGFYTGFTAGTGNIALAGGGDFSVLGGTGSTSVADVNAKGTLAIGIGSGDFTLTGGSGGTSSEARFTATGAVNLTGSNYTLTGGSSASADASNALIQSTGAGGSVSVNAINTGIVTLTGGTADGQHSYIQTTAGSGANPIGLTCQTLNLTGSTTAANASAEIATVQGDMTIAATGNSTLTGGSFSGASALIQSTTQGNIDVTCTNLSVQNTSAVGDTGILTASGDITITCYQDCVYAGSAADPTIRSVLRTFGSDLTVTAGGSITLSGFTLFSTPAPTGNLLLIAGTDITIGTNAQVTANGTVDSSLTLVVDNNYPISPAIGPGQFILDSGGIVSAGAGTPVKIYTSKRSQNSIQNTINGVAFIPGPAGVNTATEQWSVYYAGGTYEGAAFKIYYKEPNSITPYQPVIYHNITANLVQLVTLLPIFKPVLNVSYGHYHFQLCDQVNGFACDPIFSPYGSFIFEDKVFWIGTEF